MMFFVPGASTVVGFETTAARPDLLMLSERELMMMRLISRNNSQIIDSERSLYL
jgi:hypothetical protein